MNGHGTEETCSFKFDHVANVSEQESNKHPEHAPVHALTNKACTQIHGVTICLVWRPLRRSAHDNQHVPCHSLQWRCVTSVADNFSSPARD